MKFTRNFTYKTLCCSSTCVLSADLLTNKSQQHGQVSFTGIDGYSLCKASVYFVESLRGWSLLERNGNKMECLRWQWRRIFWIFLKHSSSSQYGHVNFMSSSIVMTKDEKKSFLSFPHNLDFSILSGFESLVITQVHQAAKSLWLHITLMYHFD